MIFLAQTAAPQLPPLPEGPSLERVRGPIELPTYEPWQITLAVVCGLIFLGLIIWLLIRARKKAPAIVPPYEAALAELEAASLLTEDDDERFAVLSSQALRRYLENGLGLRFSARTSEEFLHSLKGNTHFDETFHQTLREVLSAFDRIKFAQQRISADERIHMSHTVRSLINQAHATTQEKGAQG